MTDVAELGGAAGGSAAVGLADDLGRKSVIYIYIYYIKMSSKPQNNF